jgi:hypothetical protein
MVLEYLTVSKGFFLLSVKYSKTIETQVKANAGWQQGKWDDNWVLPRTHWYFGTGSFFLRVSW